MFCVTCGHSLVAMSLAAFPPDLAHCRSGTRSAGRRFHSFNVPNNASLVATPRSRVGALCPQQPCRCTIGQAVLPSCGRASCRKIPAMHNLASKTAASTPSGTRRGRLVHAASPDGADIPGVGWGAMPMRYSLRGQVHHATTTGTRQVRQGHALYHYGHGAGWPHDRIAGCKRPTETKASKALRFVVPPPPGVLGQTSSCLITEIIRHFLCKSNHHSPRTAAAGTGEGGGTHEVVLQIRSEPTAAVCPATGSKG